MRHNRDGRKLNRSSSHRKAMLCNMVVSLFAKERIHTTTAKAKEAKRLAERMITFARRGDLSARRHVAKTVRDPDVLRKLFDEIAPRYAERPGGYTRVIKKGTRRGDRAGMAILELLGKDEEGRKKKSSRKKYRDVDVRMAPEAVEEQAEKAKAVREEAEAAAPGAPKAEAQGGGAAEAAEPGSSGPGEESPEAAAAGGGVSGEGAGPAETSGKKTAGKKVEKKSRKKKSPKDKR
jgi:large subunit ribosomal protein L17